MKPEGLIGHTGFVGGNLQQQHAFDHAYNSRNIEDIRGEHFDLLVCSGVSAVKWWANKNPEEDWAKIQRLLDALTTVRADRMVLVSTVDVYPDPVGVDEHTELAELENHAYGRHRWRVEEFVRRCFPVHHIVRLPGLFGTGLKKNVIYDLMHDNGLEGINRDSAFQYYNLDHIWCDIQTVLKHGLSLVNFATEPVSTGEIIDRFFPGKKVGSMAAPQARYDMRTCHAEAFGRKGDYLYSRSGVLEDIGAFVAKTQGGIPS